jgi:hypothetical protein
VPEYHAVHGRKFGKTLCEILDIDVSRANHIIIDCPIDGAVTINVHYTADLKEITAFADEVKKYELVEQDAWHMYRLEDPLDNEDG